MFTPLVSRCQLSWCLVCVLLWVCNWHVLLCRWLVCVRLCFGAWNVFCCVFMANVYAAACRCLACVGLGIHGPSPEQHCVTEGWACLESGCHPPGPVLWWPCRYVSKVICLIYNGDPKYRFLIFHKIVLHIYIISCRSKLYLFPTQPPPTPILGKTLFLCCLYVNVYVCMHACMHACPIYLEHYHAGPKPTCCLATESPDCTMTSLHFEVSFCSDFLLASVF